LAKLVIRTFPQAIQRFEHADDFQLQRLMQPPLSLSASDGERAGVRCINSFPRR
jgi:hypothetical protein